MRALEHDPGILEEIATLDPSAAQLLERKLHLARENPFRYKRLYSPGRHLFCIKFSDRRKEKRLVYEVEKDAIIVRRIIDRDKDYRELRKR